MDKSVATRAAPNDRQAAANLASRRQPGAGTAGVLLGAAGQRNGAEIDAHNEKATTHQRLVATSPRVTAQRKQIEGAFGLPVQRQGAEEEELLQGKFDPIQRQGPEEKERLQGKFATALQALAYTHENTSKQSRPTVDQSSNAVVQRIVDENIYRAWLALAVQNAKDKLLAKPGNQSARAKERIRGKFRRWSQHISSIDLVAEEFRAVLTANGRNPIHDEYATRFSSDYTGERGNLDLFD